MLADAQRSARHEHKSIVLVTAGCRHNSLLREQMNEAGGAAGLAVFSPAPKFCTDIGASRSPLARGYQWLRRGPGAMDCSLNADAD